MEELAFFYGTKRPMAGKADRARPAKPAPRTSIAVQGARVHNSEKRVGGTAARQADGGHRLSGSGKSSLAFDTIYAEGQRRYMESLSSYAKRFVAQVAKPDVDFVFGLSPVISIEQKTIGNNPRSTVGTMTDIASYLNLLFATIAEPHCPRTGEPVPSRTPTRFWKRSWRCPKAPKSSCARRCSSVYGEELDFVLTEVRKKGCRQLDHRWQSGGHLRTRSTWTKSNVTDMDAVVDRLVVGPQHEKAIKAGIAATLLIGDGLMQVADG